MSVSRRLLFIVLTTSLVAGGAWADDWPQWRGPARDGIWREEGILGSFDGDELTAKWRVAVGAGYSGPTVAEGRVFLMDRFVAPSQVERVLCLDATTGAEEWVHTYECSYKGIGYPDGPRASVTVSDGRAYSLGAVGHFFCLDAASGEVLWMKDLKAEYKVRMPIWGLAASPLLWKDLIIVQVGGEGAACLVAFDRISGKEVWKSLEDPASYSSPIIIEQAGKPILVCWTGTRVVGLTPATGEELWAHPFGSEKMVINIAAPVVDEGYLYLSGFYDGSLLLKMSEEEFTVHPIWQRIGKSERETDSLQCLMSTPILEDGYIYGVDSYGELRCVELLTGDRVWEDLTAVPKARWANIHMVRRKAETWMFNERGDLIIGRLTPDGFKEIDRAHLIDPTEGQLEDRGGVCWSHPAYADRHIYARNDEELVCVFLGTK